MQKLHIVLLLLASVSLSCAYFAFARADEPKQVLRHVVIYSFKKETTPAQVQEVIDAFGALPKKIDTIIGYEHGLNVSEEGKSDGLTHIFVVTFRNERARDTYLEHPAHAEYVNVVKGKREKVVVFDYWKEE